MTRAICWLGLLVILLFGFVREARAVAETVVEEKAKQIAEIAREEEPEGEPAVDESEDPEEPAGEEDDADDPEADDASESDQSEQEEETEPPKPFIAEERTLRITVETEGVFVPVESVEVTLRPETWSKFEVVEAVEHGQPVAKDEVLVRFDPTDYEQAVEDKAIDDRLDEIALRQSEEALPRQEEAARLAQQTAQRQVDRLTADFERFKEIERPLSEQIANYRVEEASEYLASQREELEQLEKMYEADDLTEDTEEIVLRRQRFQVETAKLILESQEISRDYTLGVMLPRYHEEFETSLREARLTLEQADSKLSSGLTRERFALEKARQKRARQVEEHAKLLADRDLLEVRSPIEGVAYYGRCVDGKWTGVKSLKAKLQPHGKVTAGTVLMTIVQQRPLSVRVGVKEEDVAKLAEGLAVEVVPTADEELTLEGVIAEVARVPNGGDFEVMIETEGDAPEWLVAGMTCEANIVLYENESAVVIPQSLVVEGEGEERFVYVIDHGIDKPLRREVRTGRKKGAVIEVTRGLEAGDRVVPPPAEDESP